MYSYHIFYFPFKWKTPDSDGLLFSEQTDLNDIPISNYTNWERIIENYDQSENSELYNEKNYFYQFVHSLLYDTGHESSMIHHYERKETKEKGVYYKIKVKGHEEYELDLNAININLYSTGVGMLNFYIENNSYSDHNDILKINQYGRRLFPPFFADIKNRFEIAEYISIEGLLGGKSYKEDFSTYTDKDSWKTASFIEMLISDLSDKLEFEPVIDDRMFVNTTYSCQELIQSFEIRKNPSQSEEENLEAFKQFCFNDNYWYKYLFVDDSSPTCHNIEMRKASLKDQTYTRWQQYGTLYGFSRYSLVLLMGDINQYNDFLPVHMRTMYSRMIEIVLIIRASTLKFSNEIKEVSYLAKQKHTNHELIDRISSLYKEYIRFINQYYFREITAQDQGIDLYNLMLKTLKLDESIKDLDNEIEELHRYVMMLEDRERNRKASTLNLIATVFLPATLLAGLFSMGYHNGNICKPSHNFWQLFGSVLIIASLISSLIVLFTKKRKR